MALRGVNNVTIEKFPNKPRKPKLLKHWELKWADEDYIKYNTNSENSNYYYEKNQKGEWEYVRTYTTRTKV